MTNLTLLAIPGSLRKESYNRALARALAELAPESVAVQVHELHDVPLYNADRDVDGDRPEPVQRLKDAIAQADAVAFVTPEYNHGVPGVLKNAIDWASRPAFRSPMAGKPCGMMGAATGSAGTIRAQQVLKVVLLGMASQVFPHRGVAVAHARDKFDAEGNLVDVQTREFVASYLAALANWTRRVTE